MRKLIGVLSISRGIAGFGKGAMYKAILGIHDCRFRIFLRFLLHTLGRLVAMFQNLISVGERPNQLLHLLVVLKQFDGQVARRVALAQSVLLLQVILYLGNAVLYLMTMLDVDVAEVGVGTLRSLIHLNHLMEEFLHTATRGEHRGLHGHTKEARQGIEVDVVASLLRLVKHIEGHHHTNVHIDELGGQVEIALEVRSVDHINHHIGGLLNQLLANIQFLGRIGR